MPAPKVSPAVTDVERLNEPFRAIARLVLADIQAANLPMKVMETLRPLERQRYLYDRGVSKLTTGPHCYGLAMDVVLDPYDKRWPKFGARPFRAIDGGGAAWDTGYDADANGGAVLARQGVRDVCLLWGAIVKKHGLEWGGEWQPTGYANYPIGWDPYHCNLAGWRSAVKQYRLSPFDTPPLAS